LALVIDRCRTTGILNFMFQLVRD